MSPVPPLPPERLRRVCDPAAFPFETTSELPPLEDVVGQPRAQEATRFGLSIRHPGYNLFAYGPPGTGKQTMLLQALEREASARPPAADWCYIHNFADPRRPRALRLPSGRGPGLRREMETLVEDLRQAIPGAFESEEYRRRRQVIESGVKERQEAAFEALRSEAAQGGIGILRSPMGFALAPTRDGEALSLEDFRRLPEEEQKRLEDLIGCYQGRLQELTRSFPQWEKEGRAQIRDLNREVTRHVVGHLFDEVLGRWGDIPEVLAYLDAIRSDVVENVEIFLGTPESPLAEALGIARRLSPETSPFRRYQVNVMVTHDGDRGAPVVLEDHPTWQNLIGQVEHMAHLGALSTDFNLIKPGALHRANGGYLLLDARKILLMPYAWEGIKRTLRAGNIRIESLGQMLSLVSTVSIEPEPIPLDVKVVLFGERFLYYLLCEHDPEFEELFKVGVDFQEEMDRSTEGQTLYAHLVGTIARREGLLPFDRGAVAAVVEQGSRLAADAGKLSARIGQVADLLREADHWAHARGDGAVTAGDVQRAIDAQVRRMDRVRERLLELTTRGTLRIETEGEAVAQVNGLSVLTLGRFTFGHPARITARVRLGKGEVVDIEREARLGGPIHSKGVLILSGFLSARYATDRPLSLSATLTFEQSYGGVEGDSASSAECYALLSALSGAPVRQSLAVTGSVDQHGRVQAIGGVNEKVEGFFDLCRARGLGGAPGVLIPASNVQNLMLRKDVVEAVTAGRFRIYAVESIDEGIELLTGVAAGERGPDGRFPPETINGRVEARLLAMSERVRAFGRAMGKEGEGDAARGEEKKGDAP